MKHVIQAAFDKAKIKHINKNLYLVKRKILTILKSTEIFYEVLTI